MHSGKLKIGNVLWGKTGNCFGRQHDQDYGGYWCGIVGYVVPDKQQGIKYVVL